MTASADQSRGSISSITSVGSSAICNARASNRLRYSTTLLRARCKSISTGKGKRDSVYNCYLQTILWKNRDDRLGTPTAGGGREGETGTGNRGRRTASALSQLDFGVDRPQLASGVIDLHLPVDTGLCVVYIRGPSGGFGAHRLDIAEASTGHALTGQGTQFVLGDVQPTAVLGRVMEFNSADQLPCAFRLERFVERPLRVRVQVVAHEDHTRAVRVAALQ